MCRTQDHLRLVSKTFASSRAPVDDDTGVSFDSNSALAAPPNEAPLAPVSFSAIWAPMLAAAWRFEQEDS